MGRWTLSEKITISLLGSGGWQLILKGALMLLCEGMKEPRTESMVQILVQEKLLKWFPRIEVEICFIFEEASSLCSGFYAFHRRVHKLVGWDGRPPICKLFYRQLSANWLTKRFCIKLLISCCNFYFCQTMVGFPAKFPHKNSYLLILQPMEEPTPDFLGVGSLDWNLSGYPLPVQK